MLLTSSEAKSASPSKSIAGVRVILRRRPRPGTSERAIRAIFPGAHEDIPGRRTCGPSGNALETRRSRIVWRARDAFSAIGAPAIRRSRERENERRLAAKKECFYIMNPILPSRATTSSARFFPNPTTGAASSGPQQADSPFAALGLLRSHVRAVHDEGYTEPTPIQTKAIPPVLEGRDLLGCAQTGTGKTAAFVLPILQRLNARPGSGRIRALVLSPTRELAAQIDERVSVYGRHLAVRHTVIYGGVGQRAQELSLARHPELVVATPGRLLDLMRQGFVRLDAVEVFVLDEADRMLDMGFIPDVRRVVSALPSKRQTLFFSATLPHDVGELAANILHDPLRVSVSPATQTADGVAQSVYFVAQGEKRALLERILRDSAVDRALVFTRTKRGANRVSELLVRAGIAASAIHGNKSQTARERALGDFKRGRVSVLVATDIAARGIDIDGISHVVNYDLPNVPASYVHRVGRTARAGATGSAISFCDRDERELLRDIERLLGRRIPVAAGAPEPIEAPRTADRPPRTEPKARPQTEPKARPFASRSRRRRFQPRTRRA